MLCSRCACRRTCVEFIEPQKTLAAVLFQIQSNKCIPQASLPLLVPWLLCLVDREWSPLLPPHVVFHHSCRLGACRLHKDSWGWRLLCVSTLLLATLLTNKRMITGRQWDSWISMNKTSNSPQKTNARYLGRLFVSCLCMLQRRRW